MLRIKNWLKKGGKFLDQEMIDSLNPLEGIFESADYPMARIYRQEFREGIHDTFCVITGNHYGVNECDYQLNQHVYRPDMYREVNKIGILDILIFPALSRRLVCISSDILNNKDSTVSNVLIKLLTALTLFPVGMLLEAFRLMLGVILTVALLPIVALVHFIAYIYKAGELQSKMSTYKIPGKGDLVDIIQRTDYRFHSKYNAQEKSVELYASDRWSKDDGKALTSIKVCDEKNVDVIEGLLGTNSFGILDCLKKADKLNEVKSSLKPRVREAFIKEMSNSRSNLKLFKDDKIYDPNVLQNIFEFAEFVEVKGPDISIANRLT